MEQLHNPNGFVHCFVHANTHTHTQTNTFTHTHTLEFFTCHWCANENFCWHRGFQRQVEKPYSNVWYSMNTHDLLLSCLLCAVTMWHNLWKISENPCHYSNTCSVLPLVLKCYFLYCRWTYRLRLLNLIFEDPRLRGCDTGQVRSKDCIVFILGVNQQKQPFFMHCLTLR
jgi:hypothetical protein